MFESILSSTTGTLSIVSALICMASSFLMGMWIAFLHNLSERSTKSFSITLALLPVLIQVIIMMVNGNLGTSVAILGAFGLIRFRSQPGTSRELLSVFFAMAVGLSIGMGHILFAFTFALFTGLIVILLTKTPFGEQKRNVKVLKITIPENLDYTNVFTDIFLEYTKEQSLEKIKTTNMGSLYELTYRISLKQKDKEKEFMDSLRCRNGNLTILLHNEALSEL